jgi:hypothetical protein
VLVATPAGGVVVAAEFVFVSGEFVATLAGGVAGVLVIEAAGAVSVADVALVAGGFSDDGFWDDCLQPANPNPTAIAHNGINFFIE